MEKTTMNKKRVVIKNTKIINFINNNFNISKMKMQMMKNCINKCRIICNSKMKMNKMKMKNSNMLIILSKLRMDNKNKTIDLFIIY